MTTIGTKRRMQRERSRTDRAAAIVPPSHNINNATLIIAHRRHRAEIGQQK
jgi:hypothetical protein